MNRKRGKHPHGRGEDPSPCCRSQVTMETPPRAWGRLFVSRGKKRLNWKHPHGRGEDWTEILMGLPVGETPPRAWGRLSGKTKSWINIRNTPTGVGKTHATLCRRRERWKHPHGRGEDLHIRLDPREDQETPPRAWGRHPLPAHR